MIGLNELIDGFTRVGLKKSDVVLVHSSFKSFGGVEGGPQVVIDALLHVIGNSGTLIIPAFNFAFCGHQSVFDIEKTSSRMGIITEFVRKDPQSIRTKDPVYSFSIMGNLKEVLGAISYSDSYGKNSMFAELRKYDAKIMIIGLTYTESMTFFHHVEEMQKVDYRYTKEFHGKCIDKYGTVSPCQISFRVRDIERGVKTELDRMGDILEKEGIVKIEKIGNSVVKLMNANKVYNRTIKELEKNPHILCLIDE